MWADQNLLVPLPRSNNPLEILNRIVAALVDFREGDSITAVVHSARPVAAWCGANVHLALHWIAYVLSDACWPQGEKADSRKGGTAEARPGPSQSGWQLRPVSPDEPSAEAGPITGLRRKIGDPQAEVSEADEERTRSLPHRR